MNEVNIPEIPFTDDLREVVEQMKREIQNVGEDNC